MATINGTFVDATTGKPIPGVSIDFYPDGNMSNDPYASVLSDANGNFTYTSGLIDTETGALFACYQTGYNEQIGPPSAFNGQVQMTEVVEGSGTSSALVPVLIVAVIIFAVWYFKLYKKF